HPAVHSRRARSDHGGVRPGAPPRPCSSGKLTSDILVTIIRSTSVLCVRRDQRVAMGCDGQVTVGTTVMKHNAKKLRRMYNDSVLAGFAGATADAFTLFEKFESKLEEYRGNL